MKKFVSVSLRWWEVQRKWSSFIWQNLSGFGQMIKCFKEKVVIYTYRLIMIPKSKTYFVEQENSAILITYKKTIVLKNLPIYNTNCHMLQ